VPPHCAYAAAVPVPTGAVVVVVDVARVVVEVVVARVVVVLTAEVPTPVVNKATAKRFRRIISSVNVKTSK